MVMGRPLSQDLVGCGQIDGEYAAGIGVDLCGDSAVIPFDYVPANRQSEACAFAFMLGGKERLEDGLGVFGGEAGAGVTETHHGGVIRGKSGRNRQLAAIGHCIEGVLYEIAEDLKEIVTSDLREVGGVCAGDLDVQGLGSCTHRFDGVVDDTFDFDMLFAGRD
jgi:hypothetical protein